MEKKTTQLLKEIGLSDDFNTFYSQNENQMIKTSLADMLTALLSEKNLKKSDVIKRAELSEVYAYQIFSGLRVPERPKLLALAVGMGLDIDEVQGLLKYGGYPPLYAKLPFDSVLIYGICKHLSVVEINELLFEHKLPTLG